MRLIDKDALMKTLDIKEDCGDCEYENGFFCSRNSDFVNACEAICDAPTVDAVEVVRCKDCKYYHKEWDGTEKYHHEDYWCEWVEPDENDFCSLAERRSDAN